MGETNVQRPTAMKLALILLCSVVVLLAVAALAQAPQPAISEVGSGGIPSESGMYVQTAGGFNKILGQIVAFTRSGSLLASKLTAGIKARKQNVQLLGPHAQTVVDGKPVFYFIPPRQEADAGVNAGDLVLMRLEEKEERRQFEVGAQGAWRASSGISITHQIQLFRSEAKPGIYKITPAVALGKGEYALYLVRGEGMAAYVYDFSVNSPCCELSRHPDKGTDSTSQITGSQVKTVAKDSSVGPVAVATMPHAQPVTASPERQEAQYAETAAPPAPAPAPNPVLTPVSTPVKSDMWVQKQGESLGDAAKRVKQHQACLKLAEDNPSITCK
jgi:hypothetical protein